jgi:hypothetical protein
VQRLKNKLNFVFSIAIISMVIKNKKINLQQNGTQAGCAIKKHASNRAIAGGARNLASHETIKQQCRK